MEVQVIKNCLRVDIGAFRKLVGTARKADLPVHHPVAQAADGKAVHRQKGSARWFLQPHRKVTRCLQRGAAGIGGAGGLPSGQRAFGVCERSQTGIAKAGAAKNQGRCV